MHNIKPETQYPACLLLTADHDDRVVPLHTMKFVAQLQETAGRVSSKPLLVRIDVKSGHGFGKPTAKKVRFKLYDHPTLIKLCLIQFLCEKLLENCYK